MQIQELRIKNEVYETKNLYIIIKAQILLLSYSIKIQSFFSQYRSQNPSSNTTTHLIADRA